MNVTDVVTLGIAFLDANAKGWENKINLSHLDIRDPLNCMLGQIRPQDWGYSDWVAEYGASWASAYGFSASSALLRSVYCTDYRDASAVLTDEWKRVIAERIAQ